MARRHLSTDSETGVRRFFHDEPDGNRFHIETVQDISSIVKRNTQQRNQTLRRTPWGSNGATKVATIPMVKVEELINKGIMDSSGRIRDKKRMKAWLNDPANRGFRTREGQV